MKRVAALFLALILVVGMLPMSAAAAVTEKERAEIKAAVSKELESYAAKVYQADSADKAFSDFFFHSFFGNGKKLNLKESDAMVSALFNAKLTQKAFIEGIAEAIAYMDTVHEDSLYLIGGPSWYDYYYSYAFSARYNDDRTNKLIIKSLFDTDQVYNNVLYNGPINDNDEVMELLVGGTDFVTTINRKNMDGGSRVYDIDVKMSDSFDFDGDYNVIENSGFNTSNDDRLNNLGNLMTLVGLKTFQWEYSWKMSITVREDCDHTNPRSYHWSYDAERKDLISQEGDGFLYNYTKPVAVKQDKGDAYYYFKLEDTVVLAHNKPWVVEYDMMLGDAAMVWPFDSATVAGEPVFEPQSSDRIYSYHVENKVHPDGSNSLWLTVRDDSGAVVYGPAALDASQTPTAENGTLLGSPDIVINDIGSKENPIQYGYLDLRIWEDGKVLVEDASNYRKPTCAEEGGYVHSCHHCGEIYVTKSEAMLAHSYGAYVYNSDSTCTVDGTQTRICAVCGTADTVTVPNTATGHSYQTVVTVPSCTEQGYSTYTCTNCGDSYVGDYTAVKQHSYMGEITAPTCSEQGYTTYTCEDCGDTYTDDYTDPVEHSPVIDPAVAPTCVSKGLTEGSHCGVCGYVIKKQANISMVMAHTMDEGTVIKAPSNDAAGLMIYRCILCGAETQKVIPAGTSVTGPFADVTASDWFYKPVLWAVKNNVTTGKTADSFAPYEGCTRAQVVTFLWAANGKPEPKAAGNPFDDVSESDWYYNAVLWAVENGITGGVAEGKFAPDQICTRAQIVTFLWAAEKKPVVEGSNVFVDVEATAWYTTPIIWAAENGITGGIGEGKFGPNDTCTRAQVVTFLNKMYE